MATYEYSCISCEHSVEVQRPISEPEGTYYCELCGYQLARSFTVPSVQFKGSGFYSTGG